MMCRHYNKPQGCSYGEKCQFAHGTNELRTVESSVPQAMPQIQKKPQQKMQNNLMNYKIAKCKNWEKDGTCKYGENCTFAHGDSEIREKQQNILQMQPNMMMYPPFMMDPMMGQMQQMMGIPGMQVDPMQFNPMMMQPMQMMPQDMQNLQGKIPNINNEGSQANQN